MGNRKVVGGIMFLLGFIIPLMQYQILLRIVGTAGASPSAETAFYHMAPSLLTWNVIMGICSVVLLVVGVVLMLIGQRRKTT